jgi:subtilisin-like proprotein convertase family protein
LLLLGRSAKHTARVKTSRFLLPLIAALLPAFTIHAQIDATLTSMRQQIPDAGQLRTFTIALDELEIDSASRTTTRLARPAASAEQLRLQAAAITTSTGNAAALVLYEDGRERTQFTRRVLTPLITVKLRPGAQPQRIAARHRLIYRGPAAGAPEYAIFEAVQTGGALRAAEELRQLAEVELAEPQLARQQSKRLLPNDTYFANQWHLLNTGQSGGLAGTDLNITAVWDTLRGAGIRIGVVDDGLQLTHPDLSANVDTVNDRDWNDGTPDDPSPNLSFDFHGTSCAGVAAGRGNNGIGISGAAPEATLVGLRLIAAGTSDSQEAEAMAWKNDIIQVKTNSWGPADDGRTLEAPGTLTTAALQNAAENGRGGRGTIFTWAGGNGGDTSANDNSNYDGYANSIYTISVGAVTNRGTRSYYSEPGANVVISAPSDGNTGTHLGITTTDLVGNNGYNTSSSSGELSNRDYTQTFGGTSSATPLAAGGIALMLQANPNLGWRDVQEILIRSAKKVQPANTDWITNAAGFHFNHNFGAGLLDVQAAVSLASTWTNLGPQVNATSTKSGLGLAIPDNNTTGITETFNFSATNIRVEHVTVRVHISHTYRGDLAITLTSPSGTQSRLAERRNDSGDHYSNWTFSSVRHWGESSQGTWSVKIADLAGGDVGTLNSITVTVFGTTAGPVNQPPVISSATISPAGTAFTDQTLAVSGIVASDPEGDAITYAFEWQQSSNGTDFTPVAGATSSVLPLSEAQSGTLLRCKITPTAGSTGNPYLTGSVAINRRPPSLAQHGQAFSYDSDLFVASSGSAITRAAIINEFSQGSSGAKEWVEILFLQQTDARGWKVSDSNTGTLTFSTNALWQNIPAGTLLVVYNGGDVDTILPAQDTDVTDRVLVISSSNATYFSGTWPGLSNSGDHIALATAANALVDGVSFGSNATHTPNVGTVGANTSASFTGSSDSAADVAANWAVGSAANTFATPGAGNGGSNSQFITDLRNGTANQQAQFRFASTSELVPGLSIDPATGVLSGTPDVPAGDVFQIVIERYNNSTVVSQSFSLLVRAADGTANIPAGKTWTLSGDTNLPANITVAGNLNTGGHSLVIPGTLTVLEGATIVNTSGLISYLHRSGQLPRGAIFLIADALNDAADPDGDGLPNLLEFSIGTDPSLASTAGLPTAILSNGQLQFTYTFPEGAGGVSRIPQVSGDLTQWNSGSTATELVSDTTIDGMRTIVVRDLGSGQARFVRLQVTR